MGTNAFISIGINQTQGTRLYMNPIRLTHDERLRAKALSTKAYDKHYGIDRVRAVKYVFNNKVMHMMTQQGLVSITLG